MNNYKPKDTTIEVSDSKTNIKERWVKRLEEKIDRAKKYCIKLIENKVYRFIFIYIVRFFFQLFFD